MRMRQDKAKEAPEEREDGPDSREKDRVYKPEGETSPKAAEALRKGADAARGRGQRKVVPENRCKKLVSQAAGRTWDGSATPAVQWGSVPRRLFIPALQ